MQLTKGDLLKNGVFLFQKAKFSFSNNSSRSHDETSDKEIKEDIENNNESSNEFNNVAEDKEVDDDEEDDLSYKKMRSVVAKAIISNEKRKMFYAKI